MTKATLNGCHSNKSNERKGVRESDNTHSTLTETDASLERADVGVAGRVAENKARDAHNNEEKSKVGGKKCLHACNCVMRAACSAK